MATFVESLSESGKVMWAELYKQFMGKKWENPTKGERAIKCEPKLENLEEIDKLMRQKPGYSVDAQEREG